MNPHIPLPSRIPDDGAELPSDDDIATQENVDNVVQAILDSETQRRLWVRAILPVLQSRSHDSDPSGRVQLAFDLAHIAACERLERLMRSDLTDVAADRS